MALIVGFHCDVIVQLRASAKKACGVAQPRPAPCSGEVRGRSDLDPTSTAVFLVIFEHPDSLFSEKSLRLRDATVMPRTGKTL